MTFWMQTPKEIACSSSHTCSIQGSELLSCLATNHKISTKNAVFLFTWRSVKKRVFPLSDGHISSDWLTRLQFYGQRSRFKLHFLTRDEITRGCVFLFSFFFFFLRMCSRQVKIAFVVLFMNFQERLLIFVSIKTPLKCFYQCGICITRAKKTSFYCNLLFGLGDSTSDQQ